MSVGGNVKIRTLVLLLGMAGLTASGSVLKDLDDLARVADDLSCARRPFEVEGHLGYFRRDFRSAAHPWHFCIVDGRGVRKTFVPFPDGRVRLPDGLRLNDRVRLSGVMFKRNGRMEPGYTNVVFLAHQPLAEVDEIGARDMFDPLRLNRPVAVRGLVREAVRDESASNYIRLTLSCPDGIVYVMVSCDPNKPVDLSPYLGAEVRAEGLCASAATGQRRFSGRQLLVSSLEAGIRIRQSGDAESDALPDVAELMGVPVDRIARLGYHRAVGTVLACWASGNALIRTDEGKNVMVRFRDENLPNPSMRVCVRGIPETDLYHLYLRSANWSVAAGESRRLPAAEKVDVRHILYDVYGHPTLNMHCHGRPLRLEGVVRRLPTASAPHARLQFETDGFLVSADVSVNPEALEGVTVGCKVAVMGICVIDPSARTFDPRQPVDRFFLATRTPEDIVVLVRAGWWTPARLWTLAAVLGGALLVTLCWTILLRRVAERRGRELAEAQLANVESKLKVVERTRLAVELHDSLSQVLTGISLEVSAADDQADEAPQGLRNHLHIISRAIDACRVELKNCLWDLRSDALEEPDMNRAIRRALRQDLSHCQLSVRFNVPRERFSDKTAHAVLRIVRELVANALRHGAATEVKVAGCIDGGRILFSVRDNGRGFDPKACPGVRQGHFGLQGVRERVERMNGTLEIASAPGKGAKVAISLSLPKELA